MKKEKDRRYQTVRNLIVGGFIKTFREIYPTIPVSVMAKDLGMNYNRLSALVKNVQNFRLIDVFRIAALIGVDEKIILELIWNQYAADKVTKKGSSAKK